MSSVKSWVACLTAGVAACGSAGALAQSVPTLVIGRQSQPIQTTTSVPSGLVYQTTGTQTSTLSAYTEGFLFCDNIGIEPSAVTLALGHEDQSFNPAHPWAQPSALALNFAYSGGNFVINPTLDTSTLVCHSLSKAGEMAAGLTDGIFDNGYDSRTETNYNHLVNWNPTSGFDWNAPDWSEVPADACSWTAYEQAKAPEDVGCAALLGVRPGPERAPIMWTATNGITFTYVFRVDTRFGTPPIGEQSVLELPFLNSTDELDGSAARMQVRVRDAYDSTFLSDASATYCSFTNLPATLDSNVCATAGVSAAPLPNGFLDVSFAVGQQLPDQVAQSFYVAVNRHVVGAHANVVTPTVAAMIFVDPAVTPEGADKFSGDDVVFGFMPTSNGFPWMSGQ